MPETPPPPETPPESQTPEQVEAAFWTKFESNLDTWFEKKIEKYRTTSPSRTGRTTLPSIIAGMVFGNEKKD
jgi:hypothetical protein